jgi:hypothetical protein
VTLQFNTAGSLASIANLADLNLTSIDLGSFTLPSGVPCGPGFLVSVLYFKANGTFAEYSSRPIEVECNASVEIRLIF